MDSISGLSEGIKTHVLRNLYKNIYNQDHTTFSKSDCSLTSSAIIEKLKECKFTGDAPQPNAGIYGRIITTDNPDLLKNYTSDFCEETSSSSVSSSSTNTQATSNSKDNPPKIDCDKLSSVDTDHGFQILNNPLQRLSVNLIQTYIGINNRYYDLVKKNRNVNQANKVPSEMTNSLSSNLPDNVSDLNVSSASSINHSRELISPEFKPNALLLDRYRIVKSIGGGTFGQVFRAKDLLTKQDVAIKVIKNKRCFIRQAQEEIRILQKIKEFQNHENQFIRSQANYFVNFHGAFAAHNHLCIVLELLADNLFDLLHNTNYRGVSLGLTRKFARQLCECLTFLAKPEIGIIHCDLKPENILMINTKRSAIKVIDFGSSCRVDSRPYHYIQSRFYRSPEVLLGLDYGQKIDVWSLGCVIVELHTGDPLFPGQNELDQLLKIIEILGFPPVEMIEKSPKIDCFFDRIKLPDGITEIPTNTVMSTIQNMDGSRVVYRPKTIWNQNGQIMKSEFAGAMSKPLRKMIGVQTGGPKKQHLDKPAHTEKDYEPFVELVERMLEFHPEDRINPKDCLVLPFFSSSLSAQQSLKQKSTLDHVGIIEGVNKVCKTSENCFNTINSSSC